MKSELTKQTSLIAISGGIGSGKSVVAKILRCLGYSVYDCDLEARRLMDESTEIKHQLRAEFGAEVINADLSINRKVLADIVFGSKKKLCQLNRIVHGAVREDVMARAKEMSLCGEPLFVETAILYQSELDKMVDAVIEVTAPVEIRIERVMRRNNFNREEVLNRIKSQQLENFTPHHSITYIDNSGDQPLLPQISAMLAKLAVR